VMDAVIKFQSVRLCERQVSPSEGPILDEASEEEPEAMVKT
jgi:hypothetical protein